MALTLDYAPGYAAIINAYQDKQVAQQARLVAYDAAPTEFAADALAGQTPYLFSIGDETTTITAGAGKYTVRFPFAVHVTGIVATLVTASTSGVVTIDVNDGATTIISTKVTIDQDEFSSATAAAPYVLADADVAANTALSVDIDGAGTGAKGLKLWIFADRV